MDDLLSKTHRVKGMESVDEVKFTLDKLSLFFPFMTRNIDYSLYTSIFRAWLAFQEF